MFAAEHNVQYACTELHTARTYLKQRENAHKERAQKERSLSRFLQVEAPATDAPCTGSLSFSTTTSTSYPTSGPSRSGAGGSVLAHLQNKKAPASKFARIPALFPPMVCTWQGAPHADPQGPEALHGHEVALLNIYFAETLEGKVSDGTNKNPTTLDLKVGAVVRLKSGGPKMTVESIGGLIAWMWFGRGHAKHGVFDLDMLEHAADAEVLT